MLSISALTLQMQIVRDSDAVGAIIAGAGSRPAEELVTALRKVRGCQQHVCSSLMLYINSQYNKGGAAHILPGAACAGLRVQRTV